MPGKQLTVAWFIYYNQRYFWPSIIDIAKRVLRQRKLIWWS